MPCMVFLQHWKWHERWIYTSWRQLAPLQYCSKGYLESVDVTTIRWSSAKDNKRWYLLTKSMPSHHSVSTMSRTSVKNTRWRVLLMTSLLSLECDQREHQEVLGCVEACCKEVCLSIRPDKCFSYVFDGEKQEFSLSFLVVVLHHHLHGLYHYFSSKINLHHQFTIYMTRKL